MCLSMKSRAAADCLHAGAEKNLSLIVNGFPIEHYAFFTNSDLSFMAPRPSILQSML